MDENGRAIRVTAEGLVFGYRGRRGVLDGLTWTIEPGVTGLLGPNGAGKSTLLSLIVTLLPVRGGRLLIGEHDLSTAVGRSRARRELGFVPQRFSLAGELTVADTVAYAAWAHGLDRRECGRAALRALESVDLAGLADRRTRTLSGGQRQRVGIAAALAHDPRVLILDEPTAGLDPGQRLRVREVVAGLSEDRTVLVSTHLIEDVAHLCSRVGVLAGGRIEFHGTFPELESLIEDTPEGSRYGSGFERAYGRLIARVGERR
ncbi:ABC-2 type transport system ATP-binding protein [Nocardiopsis sp. Huas11]|uniref:ABC transporter ATP-binding protein n=1 Tax=Nocardiopsis sp. Huas11 TaxID=2183912 RepID=UPI000F17F83F|nr:ATP-binding cassette domain-containing protein [Nocardiopsis sp. Huas11]RKS06902.1 ABC-2 type transport system ATP-binding protein [Nocardiopsis sp. Huas11]